MKYKILDDDEVVKVKLNQAPFSIRLTCCDCGLTHDVKMLKYESLGEEELEMIFSRNRRSTAKQRRKGIYPWRK
ncbi:hypothetical protein LCGC14_0431140 [marine sediment metagenome]|uniref:Uncharacterized protein n=1 Tax=marine sediment metagenome TaxID=412755 RepID=A0A0F9SU95_9ZZZZ